MLDRRFCCAPMMDASDRHCRFLWRLISRHAVLYSEMVTTGALLHGNPERFLAYSPDEHPLALQLGGSDPKALASCARMAEDWGYDEVNLNCGCPSDRVQSGKIGACLMAQPDLVADCVATMQNAVNIPVTVKHRIGIDNQDDYLSMQAFVKPIAEAGCRTFIVHARQAWLQGLSPKENRDIPPLNYDRVYQLKQDFPHLTIVINGGIKTLQHCQTHLQHVDGVMVGREAYSNPYLLSLVDKHIYNDGGEIPSRVQILERFIEYCELQGRHGVSLNHMSRHILGLFQGVPGARKFRRHISEHAHRANADSKILQQALAALNYPHSVCD